MGKGSKADGTEFAKYCSDCYRDRMFTDDCKTAEEMQNFCRAKLAEMKYPKIAAWFFTLCIPKLKRRKTT